MTEWKKCACYTGPNGSGSRCSRNVSGSKFCKQHTTKCLKEIAQQMTPQMPSQMPSFKQQMAPQPVPLFSFKKQPSKEVPKTCACHTGPKGTGPRCSRKSLPGSKFCGAHMKKCLKEIAQQQPSFKQQQMPTTFKAFEQQIIQQPSVFKQMVQPVFKQQPKPKKVAEPRGCVKQTDKKYTSRPSPPFPANECCGETFLGNNGKQWISKANVKGICSWKEIKE
jgi:hypothetical protein